MQLYTFCSYTPGEGKALETRWYRADDTAWDHAAAIIAKYPETARVDIYASKRPLNFKALGTVVNKQAKGA